MIVEVVEGDPRNVLCEAVEKHHASILVVGSHGYGAIKRYNFILVLVIILTFAIIDERSIISTFLILN